MKIRKAFPPIMAEQYHAIVKENGHDLRHVPEGMKTPEMCRTAFFSTQDLGFDHCGILQYIPYPEVCLEALKDSEGHVDMTDLARMLRPEVIDKEIAEFLVGHEGCCFRVFRCICRRRSWRCKPSAYRETWHWLTPRCVRT